MQANKMFYGQYAIHYFFTKGKGNSKIKNNYNCSALKLVRILALTALSSITLFSSIVSASAITDDMSPEVVAEFNKQLNLQTWPEMKTKLALMDNPYKKFDKIIRKKLKAEKEAGQRRRLRTHDESMIKAKKMRFDYCQASVLFYADFAKRAFTLSTLEQQPLTKDKLMKGNGVEYPFTEAETNNKTSRPVQIALTLGWKYQGKGEAHVETFLSTCLDIPIDLYFSEDKFK